MGAKREDSLRSFFLAESRCFRNCSTRADYVVCENRIPSLDIQVSGVYLDLGRGDSFLVKDGVFRAQFFGDCCCPGLRLLVRPNYHRVLGVEIIHSVSSEQRHRRKILSGYPENFGNVLQPMKMSVDSEKRGRSSGLEKLG